MTLLERLKERWHDSSIEAIRIWDTDVHGELGVFRSKAHGSINLVIATPDDMVIQVYASVSSAMEDATIIADFAGAV